MDEKIMWMSHASLACMKTFENASMCAPVTAHNHQVYLSICI